MPKAVPHEPRRNPPSAPRLRPYLAVAVILVAGYVVASGLTLYKSWAERDARLGRLRDAAAGLSILLDREVESARALLTGLSSSPLIESGDFAAFHAQLLSTPHPDGVALVLSDHERQLVNALVPYGTELPLLSFFEPQPGFFERLEAEGFHVSSRIRARFQAAPSTVVSIKVPGPDGHLRYFLSLAINRNRLLEVLRGVALPQGAGLLVVDAMGQEIASQQPEGAVLGVPELMAKVARDPGDLRPARGLFAGTDTAGNPIWTAYARSALTGWNASASQPADAIGGAFADTLRLLAAAGLLLLGALVALRLLWRRRVEAPFASMENLLDEAHRQIVQMRHDVDDVRQQEHRRIAQELHDSTAQHLVAADLHLSALRRGKRHAADLAEGMTTIQELIEQSLRELRSFSFLLRPVTLGARPFREMLADLFSVYASRAGLEAEVEVAPAADELPPEMQLALYRVAREALTNIHRHANAKWIAARLIPAEAGWDLVVSDDGAGGITFPSDVPRPGLGIRGMADTVAALGGTLTISDTGAGTRLHVTVPVQAAAPVMPAVALAV